MTNQEIREAVVSGSRDRIARVIEKEASNPYRLATEIIKAHRLGTQRLHEQWEWSLGEDSFRDWMEINDIGKVEPQITRIIELSGKSGRALAKEYGIPYQTFSKWMTGENKAPQYTLDMLERLVWTKRQIGEW